MRGNRYVSQWESNARSLKFRCSTKFRFPQVVFQTPFMTFFIVNILFFARFSEITYECSHKKHHIIFYRIKVVILRYFQENTSFLLWYTWLKVFPKNNSVNTLLPIKFKNALNYFFIFRILFYIFKNLFIF